MFDLKRLRAQTSFVVLACLLALQACGRPDPSAAGNTANLTVTPIEVPGTETMPPPPPVPCDADPMTPVEKARLAFPATVPSTAGYKLVDAFPDLNPKLELPLTMVWPSTGGPMVLEFLGRIVQIENNTKRVLLNITHAVNQEGEAGALGMALHPRFGDGTGDHPYVYVWYNAKGSIQRLSRFSFDATRRIFGNELVLVEQVETHFIHNGGNVAFGRDGFLYFSNGDDFSEVNHQTISRALFGGIFRIDVDMRGGSVSHAPVKKPEGAKTQGYFIPNDNPFVGVPNALEEYYALGLRNPFGFSFDSKTGELYAGDVGDTWREEINRVVPGGNYEWPFREGGLVRGATPKNIIGNQQKPLYSEAHAVTGDLSALLGGFIYRGGQLPELDGKFIYANYPSSRMWAADLNSRTVTPIPLIETAELQNARNLVQGPGGEIYLMQLFAAARLVRDDSKDNVAKTLSETPIFTDTAKFELDPAFVQYTVNSPLWSDGASKPRYIRVPEGKRATIAEDGSFVFPEGTVFIKQFNLPENTRREMRVTVKGNDDFYHLGYRWNCAGTDAKLVIGDTTDEVDWHFPSFGQCWACHRPENRVLGFRPEQLDDGAGQIQRLEERGVIDMGDFKPVPLTKPTDAQASIESRALAYLAANCSGCHHKGASYLDGSQTWIASPGVPLEERGLIGVGHHNLPVATGLGMSNALLIDPGKPGNSLLLARMKTSNQDLRMPPLGRKRSDELGVQLVEEWISGMKP